jgi:hypothetical protein
MMKPYRLRHGTPVVVQLFALKIDAEALELCLKQASGLAPEHQEHLVSDR